MTDITPIIETIYKNKYIDLFGTGVLLILFIEWVVSFGLNWVLIFKGKPLVYQPIIYKIIAKIFKLDK